MKRARRNRKLSADEQRLWKKVTSTVSPMHTHIIDRAAIDDTDFATLFEPPQAIPPEPQGRPGRDRAEESAAIKPPAPSRPRVAPSFDRPVYRKIARGHTAIDATLDLHHMSQQQAHARLQSFLAQSHALGLRHVLVITGKGSSPSSDGVLRRMVPVWLETMTFASLVSGYQTAARGHGGEGAFYIRLARPRDRKKGVRR